MQDDESMTVQRIPIGNEPWIEPVKTHIDPGEEVLVTLKSGDMQNGGVMEVDPGWWMYVISPHGKRLFLPVEYTENALPSSFFTPHEVGCYTIIAGHHAGVYSRLSSGEWCRKERRDLVNGEISGYYFQYAKTNVNVGDSFQKPAYAACDLEICMSPIDLDHHRVSVHYAGQPLSDATVLISGTSPDSKTNSRSIRLDSFGKGEVVLPHQNEWILLVAQTDYNRSIRGRYDYTHFSSTLSLPFYDDSA